MKVIEVDVITLDDFVDQNAIKSIDFIKIDVEQNELKTLKGARKTLEKFKPILMLEVTIDFQEIKDLLLEIGFKSILEENLNPIIDPKNSSVNWLCFFDEAKIPKFLK